MMAILTNVSIFIDYLLFIYVSVEKNLALACASNAKRAGSSKRHKKPTDSRLCTTWFYVTIKKYVIAIMTRQRISYNTFLLCVHYNIIIIIVSFVRRACAHNNRHRSFIVVRQTIKLRGGVRFHGRVKTILPRYIIIIIILYTVWAPCISLRTLHYVHGDRTGLLRSFIVLWYTHGVGVVVHIICILLSLLLFTNSDRVYGKSSCANNTDECLKKISSFFFDRRDQLYSSTIVIIIHDKIASCPE